jgi:CHAT domain
VVHIIGVCRRVRVQNQEIMEIYLDDGVSARWQSPGVLVNLFSGNEELATADQVRLVVLHLCEPSPLDFEVTFERLAPALVRKGIPAVVAMQYPLSGNAAGRFIKKLYEGLAEGRSIEEAVQAARSDLFVKFEEDRLFGSPVLYMQSVDSQLLPLPTGSPAGADAGPSSVSAAQAPPRSTLDWLLQQLTAMDEPPAPRNEAAQILQELGDWPPLLSEVERRLARQVRDYAYRPDLAGVFSALVKVVQQEMSQRDD